MAIQWLKKKEVGFTYPELLIVVIIIAFIAIFTWPIYKRFNALQEIRVTANGIRDQIRTSQNKSVSGIKSSNGYISNWVTHVHHNGFEFEYETAACPVITNSGTSGYVNRYTFNSCPNRSDYQLYTIPGRLSISHQYSDEPEANLFFASITGSLTIYNQYGTVLGNAIDIKISSTEYPDMYIILHVNSRGDVTQENHDAS
jgi:type II secretory pathway pseudopilin PulG